MPENHRNVPSPWSLERFTSWAGRIGPHTKEAIERVMRHKVIVEQSFVSCRNILGLAKRYTPELLEQASKRFCETPAVPSYTALKNTILSIKAEREHAKSKTHVKAPVTLELFDRAKEAGHVHGAEAYKRKGADDAS